MNLWFVVCLVHKVQHVVRKCIRQVQCQYINTIVDQLLFPFSVWSLLNEQTISPWFISKIVEGSSIDCETDNEYNRVRVFVFRYGHWDTGRRSPDPWPETCDERVTQLPLNTHTMKTSAITALAIIGELMFTPKCQGKWTLLIKAQNRMQSPTWS